MYSKLKKLHFAILVASAIIMLIAVYMAFIYTPAHEIMGDVQRIFYFHVATAWVSYLAFFVVFLCCIMYLKSGVRKWDTTALSSAEVGVLFCTFAIITGSLWAKAVWGVYWRLEDTKLTVTFILWLIYVSYLVLRSRTETLEKRARLAAVFGIVGFFCVPLSFFASRIWVQYHPTVIATERGSLQPVMGYALLVAVCAFTLFYLYVLIKRIELENLLTRAETLKEIIYGRI
jgi:heme exporter protein C